MIWFSYTDKLYIKMLGIVFSPQKYHHHQQFLFKFKENTENDMTFVVWGGTVFGPRLWQLSARRRLLSASSQSAWLENFFIKLPTYVVLEWDKVKITSDKPSYSQFNPVWIFPPFLDEEIRQQMHHCGKFLDFVWFHFLNAWN